MSTHTHVYTYTHTLPHIHLYTHTHTLRSHTHSHKPLKPPPKNMLKSSSAEMSPVDTNWFQWRYIIFSGSKVRVLLVFKTTISQVKTRAQLCKQI